MLPRKAAEFLTTLHVRRADDPSGGTWELTRPLVYRSEVADDTFVIPKGFRTDYASVPRLPFAYLLFGGVAQEAAVVHDFLYQRGLVSRKVADDVFAEASKVMGVSGWRRGAMWLGVRLFGGLYYDEKSV